MERASKFGRPTSVESTEGIEARIAMIEGRYEDALAHWTAMREHLTRRHGDSGIVRYLWNRIEAGEVRYNAAMNPGIGYGGICEGGPRQAEPSMACNSEATTKGTPGRGSSFRNPRFRTRSSEIT